LTKPPRASSLDPTLPIPLAKRAILGHAIDDLLILRAVFEWTPPLSAQPSPGRKRSAIHRE
jgi:hypothetical protein